MLRNDTYVLRAAPIVYKSNFQLALERLTKAREERLYNSIVSFESDKIPVRTDEKALLGLTYDN